MTLHNVEEICNLISCIEMIGANARGIVALVAHNLRLLASSEQKRKPVSAVGAATGCELSITTFVLTPRPLPASGVHVILDRAALVDFRPEI